MTSTTQPSDPKKEPPPPPAPSSPSPPRPTLPPNVSIFSPADPAAARGLLAGRLFTRLTVSARAAEGASRLAEALRRGSATGAAAGGDGGGGGGGGMESFCLAHGRAALVFDAGGGGEGGGGGGGVEDAHHEHVRAVCLALRDADLALDVAGCVFDAPEAPRAGFQLDRLAGGAVMVVDIMDGGEEDDSEEGSDLGSDLEGFLAGGEAVR